MRNMLDDGDDDLSVAAAIVLSVLNDKIKHTSLTNSNIPLQLRDSKFLVKNITVFSFIQISQTRKNSYKNL